MSDPLFSDHPEPRPAVIAVGGLDPSGGAGILRDSAVIADLGGHPLVVATGIAVQNTSRLAERHDLSGELVQAQLEVLAEEFRPGAIKTGMLGTPAIVEAVGSWLERRPRLPLVLDPVLRTTSGGELGDPGTLAALRRTLIPRARVMTPNLEEAAVLSGRPVPERDEIPAVAGALREQGPQWVLVTGGHLARGRAADFLCGPDGEFWLEDALRPGDPVRGTGCFLAAALAVGLARGESVPDAARAAKAAVTRAIDRGYVAGRGRFPGFTGSDPDA